MSWNIEVTGANKQETLSAFDEAVNKDANCEPKDAIKSAVLMLCAHMDDGFVTKIRSNGHTQENGKHCTAAVFVNQ